MGNPAKFYKFKKFSGPGIKGTADQESVDMLDGHFERALWLTSEVESGGRFGAVTMYDGTGVTAGLHQAIAVYPRNLKEQGPLFKLLRRIDAFFPIAYYKLGYLLSDMDWMIAEDGHLRSKRNGQIVPPREFRNIVTPNGGVVPRTGPLWHGARTWAEAFHETFIHPNTRLAQVSYGKEHFVKKCKRLKHPKLGRKTIEDLVYGGECLNPDVFDEVPWTDLAMAVFWSHSVNGPAPALTRLGRALKACKDVRDPKFAKVLLRQLANATYGRWVDDLPSGRWARTRNKAIGVWTRHLFYGDNAVMPRYL